MGNCIKLLAPVVSLILSALATHSVASEYTHIGQRVWMNECAGSTQGLVSWNAGERFPSLGIGHFIWYPAGVREAFNESFPKFVAYARAHGVAVPTYFHGAAPWPNRASFLADHSGLANQMRHWLATHLELQTQFLIARSQASLNAMLRVTRKPEEVKARYAALSRTAQGLYCLVDYVNFKGEGTNPAERYSGQGWGLLQVLEEMRAVPSQSAPTEFSRAAEIVMRRRVKNSPPARGEQRWLAGWVNRCKTYRSSR